VLPLLAMFFLSASNATPASHLTGDWITSNHSVVRVYPCSGSQLCARVVTVGPKNEPQNDVNNPDTSLRQRPICGLTIGTGFAPSGDSQASDGHIYDPESGKTYSAQMKTKGDTLQLRGYVGISLLGRTETWHRTANTAGSCS
jgi:uncharacterized protein (DUF2147 family)